MDVREKLVELLNKANSACVGTDCFEGCKFYIENDCLYKLMEDLMIANGVTVQEWISVNDKLPEDGESVLTYKNGNVDVQVYEKNRNGWIQGNWFWSMATVTHWMPLPEPPKGE